MRRNVKFYNYDEIWIAAHGDPKMILEYYKDSKSGNSFIVNPKALVDAFWVSDRHKAEYLGLCSLRNYNDYLERKEVDLHIDLIPTWVPIEVIKDNPLVTLTETKVIFKKEKI